tara:strand:+ start:7582 stop:8538 length:957 start_codon:yes stop_codon:yes gene_type:complete
MVKRRPTHAQRKRHREAADWAMRNREADFSGEDLRAFHQWLDEDQENQRAYDAAEQLLGDACIAIKSDPDLKTFEAKPASPRKAVAGTLLGLAFATGLFFALDGPMRLRADVVSGVAELPIVRLDDGSIIHMNALSAIAVDYSDQVRKIRLLRGEAFFEVAADPQRAFTVEAGDTRVTALGTAFNIHRADDETDVTVTHHSVLVEFADPDQTQIRLNEGEHVGYDTTGAISQVTPKDAASALAWRKGLLVLDNVRLSHVAQELERHFTGRILIASPGLADRRISGTMAISDTPAALAFLEQALNLNVTKIGPIIILSD